MILHGDLRIRRPTCEKHLIVRTEKILVYGYVPLGYVYLLPLIYLRLLVVSI